MYDKGGGGVEEFEKVGSSEMAVMVSRSSELVSIKGFIAPTTSLTSRDERRKY